MKTQLLKKSLLFNALLMPLLLFGKPSREQLFSNFYKIGHWDESGFSLSGLQIEIT